jgi:tRNA threonylcarbamoyl adenosine modification protein YeaZ
MSVHKKIFLALDTSSEIGAVILFDNTEIYYAQSLKEKFSHGQGLFEALNHALILIKNQNMSLDAVFVGLGPGSFVGLRIALAAALGFCWGRSLPLMGFCSHRAFASGYDEKEIKNIYVATKASGDLCYLTSFGLDAKESSVVSKSEITSNLKDSSCLITNLDFEQEIYTKIITSYGPSFTGMQKACLHKLSKLGGQVIDEINYIKPNYVKAPSVSTPKLFSALRVS